ncbi:MAG: 16S rRNA (adenine(1518)-N(6)/adenine(1519)-N(6)) -dimethyltransferase RsmA [Rhodothermales bacterium]
MIKPKKSLGQNFLQDPNTIRKIVAALPAPDDAHVVEIGPGLGALTGLLRERFRHFTALEVDQRAIRYLHENHPGVDVRHQDVLSTNWAALKAEHNAPLYVIGNLPYYITTPILFGLLDAHTYLEAAILMMQKEVADRLVAPPRTKTYGTLSVQTQLWSTPKLMFKVSPNVFFPKPGVDSAIVRLTFDVAPPDFSRDAVSTVVRAAFNQRRKTLHNSLSAWTRERGLLLPESWAKLRADAVPPDLFVEITRYLMAHDAE